MDFLGDVVEHEVKPPEPLSFPAPGTLLGFPKISKQKPSLWRSRLQQKGISSMSNASKLRQTLDNKQYSKNKNGLNEFTDEKDKKFNYEGMSEAERIHQENIEILSRMSVEEREKEKQELIDSLDPEILQMLLNRSMGRKPDDPPLEDETGEWYGSSKDNGWGKAMDEESVNRALGIKSNDELEKDMVTFNQSILMKKIVSFKDQEEIIEDTEDAEAYSEDVEAYNEEVQDLDELIPSKSQIERHEAESGSNLVTGVHFPKAPSTTESDDDDDDYKLDLNDPDFNEKLHEKYFPDLPKDTENLKWMQPLPDTEAPEIIEGVKDLRFDFNGDLINPEGSKDIPTYVGLHHHAEQPQLPGYTLSELSHYSRSSFNSQRCIAIQTIGRILHKLGKNKYNFKGVDESGEFVEEEGESDNLNDKLWDLIDELKIMDTLNEFSDEARERNLSVRNYCIELLWLWREGGGDKRIKKADK